MVFTVRSSVPHDATGLQEPSYTHAEIRRKFRGVDFVPRFTASEHGKATARSVDFSAMFPRCLTTLSTSPLTSLPLTSLPLRGSIGRSVARLRNAGQLMPLCLCRDLDGRLALTFAARTRPPPQAKQALTSSSAFDDEGFRCAPDKREDAAHSKRSAAVSSQSLELSFGHAMDASLVRTASKGERRTRRNDGWAHSSF